jgi:hypothetical protein
MPGFEPIEGASIDELRALQLTRLRATLASASAVPHYRTQFRADGVFATADELRRSESPCRRHFAVNAREQAYCHFSPALISNLETHWNAANRSL